MKKMHVFLLGIGAILASFGSHDLMAKAANEETHSLQVHYHRTDGQYEGKYDFWIWSKTPGGDGKAYAITGTDEYGGYSAVLPLTSLSATKPTEVGVIYRTAGKWGEVQSADIIAPVPATSENGIFHMYLLDGSNSYYTEVPEENIVSAEFTGEKTITVKMFVLNTVLTKDDLEIYANDQKQTATINYNASKNIFTATLPGSPNLDQNYVAKVNIGGRVVELPVGLSGLYDTSAFVEKYYYDGDDLGAVISEDKSKTTFKLWAPLSSKVTLKLYDTGTPAQYGGSDVARKEVEMTLGEKGIWSHVENGNLHNTYYTYEVTNNGVTNETIDPYAKGCGVNGIRGLVVDFSQVNPEGFEYGKRADSIEKRSDASIYELHIRDYTKSENWGGTPAKQGKYLGLAETGTYYEDQGKQYATGLDHLKELGVSHIQILPIYDQATVDESSANPDYNWGYDPLNYNCLEGSYASDAKDGLVRIREFKEMMMALTDAGIRVNMDVVYNHTAKSADSNFDLIVPGYYHRMTKDGSFSNGSGCGNEMASERAMVRKFILDSTKFLYTEYNFSGYRFDLMALLDKTTMQMVYEQLYEIDPLTLVYGEPWTGGTSTLPDGQGANKQTVKYIVKEDENNNILGGVGKFNDDTRDGIVGRIPSPNTPGWLQADQNTYTGLANYNSIKFGITGGTSTTNTSYVKDATQTINYVSCHDNNTLWDKIRKTFEGVDSWKNFDDCLKAINMQADTIVFFSEGIPFIQEGQEFLRSKPKVAGYGEGTVYDHNSYRSPDSVNMVRWELKAENDSIFDYYKDLIQFRKDHEAFKMTSASEIKEKLTFLEDDNTKNHTAIMYRLQCDKDIYQDMIVIHNVAETATFTLPEGKWAIAYDSTGIVEDAKVIKEGEITLEFNQSVVLYNKSKVAQGGGSGCGKSSMSILGVVFATFSVMGVVLLKKKQGLAA